MEIISNNTMESKGVIEKNEMFFWDNVEYSLPVGNEKESGRESGFGLQRINIRNFRSVFQPFFARKKRILVFLSFRKNGILRKK